MSSEKITKTDYNKILDTLIQITRIENTLVRKGSRYSFRLEGIDKEQLRMFIRQFYTLRTLCLYFNSSSQKGGLLFNADIIMRNMRLIPVRGDGRLFPKPDSYHHLVEKTRMPIATLQSSMSKVKTPKKISSHKSLKVPTVGFIMNIDQPKQQTPFKEVFSDQFKVNHPDVSVFPGFRLCILGPHESISLKSIIVSGSWYEQKHVCFSAGPVPTFKHSVTFDQKSYPVTVQQGLELMKCPQGVFSFTDPSDIKKETPKTFREWIKVEYDTFHSPTKTFRDGIVDDLKIKKIERISPAFPERCVQCGMCTDINKHIKPIEMENTFDLSIETNGVYDPRTIVKRMIENLKPESDMF